MWVIVGVLDLIESRGKWQGMKTPSSDRVTEGGGRGGDEVEMRVYVCGAWHMIV